MKRLIPIILFLVLSCSHILSFSQDIRINEIVSANSTSLQDAYGNYSDWIEIKNYSNQAVNLQGYFLSDNPSNPLKWAFPNVDINANAYLIVFASEDSNIGDELHANFKLSKEGEVISLYNEFGVLIDRIDSVALTRDISYGRPSNNPGEFAFFAQPTPGSTNNTSSYIGVLQQASLSHESGFYSDPISVTASHSESGVSIRYTLDGSEPTEYSALYNSAWQFVNIENQENVVSMIPTNPGFDYPVPNYDEDRANSRGWLPPFQKVNKTNILKIKAFKANYLPSETAAATFFINPENASRYSLPVVSLISEPDHYFSDESGIYVYGNSEEGNYAEHGIEWERLTLMQYFENDGTFAFEQELGARIHGGGGRNSAIKNLRMYARDEYGKTTLEYDFFKYADADEFKRFMIRGPGHRPDCAPRDDFADLLLQNLNMDIQHIQPVIVFLNGEYWGIHTIKERFDQKYLELKFGKKDDDYVILRNSGTLDSGDEGDETPYLNLLEFVSEEDMGDDENYEYVKSQIDIDNYLDYFSSQVYMGNVDWINTNIKFWRYKGFDKSPQLNNGLDGKWRWFMYDFDLVFGGSCRDITPFVNILEDAFDSDYGNATKLARGLRENQQFVYDLVNRMCDRMNSNFSESFFLKQLDTINSILTPHMHEHIERWRYPSISETLEERSNEIPTLTQWNAIIEELEAYPQVRKRKMIDHMTVEFDLDDSIHIELDVNSKMMGNLQINSLFISEHTDGVHSNVYPWHGTYFEDVPFKLIAIPKLGYRFVEWEETANKNDTLILDLDEGIKLTAIFEEDPDFNFDDALYINEFMASNESIIKDDFDAHSDWIEIFNPNNTPVDLASFYISDDQMNPYKYQFERGTQQTIIPPQGFLLIWCDNRDERGVLHTNFKLDASGEDIVLTAPDGTLIDNITFGTQSGDISYGREKDGDAEWKLFQRPIGPTPGATNNNASINELALMGNIMYPNPVKQGRQLYFINEFDVKVFSLLGKEILTHKKVRSINTDKLSSGVYILVIEDVGNLKLIVE